MEILETYFQMYNYFQIFPFICVAQENQTSTALSKTPSQKSSEKLNQYLIFQKIEQIHTLLPVFSI